MGYFIRGWRGCIPTGDSPGKKLYKGFCIGGGAYGGTVGNTSSDVLGCSAYWGGGCISSVVGGGVYVGGGPCVGVCCVRGGGGAYVGPGSYKVFA